MSDIPSFVDIREEGPREGFQIEPGPISTENKARLIHELAETGVREIQTVSFANPKRVPGMADAEAVLGLVQPKEGVRYTALCMNAKGVERAVNFPLLKLYGSLITSASEPFLKKNQGIDLTENLTVQRDMVALWQNSNLPIERIAVMAAFGCNFKGDVSVAEVLASIAQMVELGDELGLAPKIISLADTMAWATPKQIKTVVGAVREVYPDHKLVLQLHDTRGMGLANAYAGMQMGIDMFDTAVAGLGGCPFAAHRGAAGNVCTEDLVFLCEEMGIETGINLEKIIEVGRLAEEIVGHPLPGKMKVGGSLSHLRATQA